MTKVRFAPSPTGFLHIGNARPALYNWLFALSTGGHFLLRYDDTDRARSTAAFAAAIAEDLDWLGIRPDAVMRQSDRTERYRAATDGLIARGLVYPCYETAEDLDFARRRRRARGLPPVYDRAALRLSAEDRARLEAEGRRPHWRFLLPNFDGDPFSPRRTEIVWDDIVRGRETVDLASLSDPVIQRADETWLYTLPSVVDDIDGAISHVIRGEDHVTNTGVQIALFRALGAVEPAFAHINLLTDSSGEGLSKRAGALSLRSLREDGIEPEAVAALAVLTGTGRPVEPVARVADLAVLVDLHTVSRSAARFDPADLAQINARLIHAMPFEEAAQRLAAMEIPADPAFWAAVSGNCARFRDVRDWWRAIDDPSIPEAAPEDAAFLAEAGGLLPDGPFGPETFKVWTDALKAATGRKGRALFMPLRLALTGRDHGPEMGALLPLIGPERAKARLSAAARPA